MFAFLQTICQVVNTAFLSGFDRKQGQRLINDSKFTAKRADVMSKPVDLSKYKVVQSTYNSADFNRPFVFKYFIPL